MLNGFIWTMQNNTISEMKWRVYWCSYRSHIVRSAAHLEHIFCSLVAHVVRFDECCTGSLQHCRKNFSQNLLIFCGRNLSLRNLLYAEIWRYLSTMPILFCLYLMKYLNRYWWNQNKAPCMFTPCPKASLNTVLRDGVIKILPTILLTLLLITSAIKFLLTQGNRGTVFGIFSYWAGKYNLVNTWALPQLFWTRKKNLFLSLSFHFFFYFNVRTLQCYSSEYQVL